MQDQMQGAENLGPKTAGLENAAPENKDDRAIRPIYGCPENFRDSLTIRPRLLFQKFYGLYWSDGTVRKSVGEFRPSPLSALVCPKF